LGEKSAAGSCIAYNRHRDSLYDLHVSYIIATLDRRQKQQQQQKLYDIMIYHTSNRLLQDSTYSCMYPRVATDTKTHLVEREM